MKTLRKRFLSSLLILTMVGSMLVFTSCGKKNDTDKTVTSTEDVVSDKEVAFITEDEVLNPEENGDENKNEIENVLNEMDDYFIYDMATIENKSDLIKLDDNNIVEGYRTGKLTSSIPFYTRDGMYLGYTKEKIDIEINASYKNFSSISFKDGTCVTVLNRDLEKSLGTNNKTETASSSKSEDTTKSENKTNSKNDKSSSTGGTSSTTQENTKKDKNPSTDNSGSTPTVATYSAGEIQSQLESALRGAGMISSYEYAQNQWNSGAFEGTGFSYKDVMALANEETGWFEFDASKTGVDSGTAASLISNYKNYAAFRIVYSKEDSNNYYYICYRY